MRGVESPLGIIVGRTLQRRSRVARKPVAIAGMKGTASKLHRIPFAVTNLKRKGGKALIAPGTWPATNVIFEWADRLYHNFGPTERATWRAAVKRRKMSGYDLWMHEAIPYLYDGLPPPDHPSIHGGYSNPIENPGTRYPIQPYYYARRMRRLWLEPYEPWGYPYYSIHLDCRDPVTGKPWTEGAGNLYVHWNRLTGAWVGPWRKNVTDFPVVFGSDATHLLHVAFDYDGDLLPISTAVAYAAAPWTFRYPNVEPWNPPHPVPCDWPNAVPDPSAKCPPGW